MHQSAESKTINLILQNLVHSHIKLLLASICRELKPVKASVTLRICVMLLDSTTLNCEFVDFVSIALQKRKTQNRNPPRASYKMQ